MRINLCYVEPRYSSICLWSVLAPSAKSSPLPITPKLISTLQCIYFLYFLSHYLSFVSARTPVVPITNCKFQLCWQIIQDPSEFSIFRVLINTQVRCFSIIEYFLAGSSELQFIKVNLEKIMEFGSRHGDSILSMSPDAPVIADLHILLCSISVLEGAVVYATVCLNLFKRS